MSTLETRRMKLFMTLVMAMGLTVLVSNLAATKIWSLFTIPVDGGLILFPLSYILGDLAVEFFGRKMANQVALVAAILNLISAGILAIASNVLPPYPGWEGQAAFSEIFGFFGRVTIASLSSFVASSLMNNFVFEVVKKRRGKSYFARAIMSSVFARLVDSTIFETVAFFGVLSVSEFVEQAIFAYLAGMILELILSVPALGAHKIVHRFLEGTGPS